MAQQARRSPERDDGNGHGTRQPDHELESLEEDQTIPPRPEELIADAGRIAPESAADPATEPAAEAVTEPVTEPGHSQRPAE